MRPARVAALAAAAAATVLLVVPSAFAANGYAQPQDDTPGVVTIVAVGPGGGSGEVGLTWEALADATGYRVLRSDTADGEFEVTAELDVTTGAATAAADVVNVFSGQHSYVPAGSTFEGPDQSPQFSYVDLGPRQRCYRVIAFNTAGDGPSSDVACGAPPGVEPEPPTTAETPGPSLGAVTVTEPDCGSVTVTGAGWEQTDATVEVAVPPSEGGESRADLVAGPVQAFPDSEGNIAPTVVPFDVPPPDGDYAAVVLVDNIVRGQSAGFTLTGCRAPTATTPPTTDPPVAALPRTGSSTLPLLTVSLLLVGLGLALVRTSRTS